MQPKIPPNYRQLSIGETIQEGDMFWFENRGPWTEYPVSEDDDTGVNESIGTPLSPEQYPIIRLVENDQT